MVEPRLLSLQKRQGLPLNKAAKRSMLEPDIKAYPTLMQLFLKVSQENMLVSACENTLSFFLSEFDHIIDTDPVVVDQPRTNNK